MTTPLHQLRSGFSLGVLCVLCGEAFTACRPSNHDRDAPPAIAYQQHVNAGGVAPAGGTLNNPFRGDKAAAADGEKVFSTMNCDGCHGGGATGWVGPSLVDGRWRYGGADGELYSSIFYGRPRGMPAYGGILGPDVIWKMVTYIQAQPVPRNVPTQSWIEATDARPAPVREESRK